MDEEHLSTFCRPPLIDSYCSVLQGVLDVLEKKVYVTYWTSDISSSRQDIRGIREDFLFLLG